MAENIFCGSGREVSFDNGSSIVYVTLNLAELKEHIYDYNGKKYVNLTVGARKEPDQFGKTHYVKINTFKPEEKKAKSEKVAEPKDDLPF